MFNVILCVHLLLHWFWELVVRIIVLQIFIKLIILLIIVFQVACYLIVYKPQHWDLHPHFSVHRAVNSFRGVILLVSRYALIRIILKLTQQIL